MQHPATNQPGGGSEPLRSSEPPDRDGERAGPSSFGRITLPSLCLVASLGLLSYLFRPLLAEGLPMRPLDRAALAFGWQISTEGIATLPAAVRVAGGPNRTITLSSPRSPFSADVVPSPLLRLQTDPPEARIAYTLQWRRAGDTNEYSATGIVRTQFAGPDDTTVLTLSGLAMHPAWKGTIEGFSWTLRTDAAGVTLLAAGAPGAETGALLAQLWREWWHVEPIDAVSINSIRAPHPLGMSPTAILGLAGSAAILAFFAQRSLRKQVVKPAAVLGIALVCWAVNDTRWAAGQWRQLKTDRRRFATPDSAVLAAPSSAALAEFVAAVRERVQGGVYLVAGGNLPTAGGDSRLRYLLAPRLVQVNLDPLQPRVPPEQADFVFVLRPEAVAFDEASDRLSGPGIPPMRAKVIHRLPSGAMILKRVDR